MTYWNGTGWESEPVADPPRPRRGRRLLGAATEGGLVTLLIFGLIAGTALAAPGGGKGAGKGGGGGNYTVAINESGPYMFGSAVTITTDAPLYPQNAGPWISLACYQNGVKVGTADHAGFEGGWYYGMPFALGPSASWTGGDADCTFTVFHVSNKRTVVDAFMSFQVDG